MSILWRCPKCYSVISLDRKTCKKCGTKVSNKEKIYVVHVCFKRRRKSATVQTLTQARELEAQLKNELINDHFNPSKEKEPGITFEEFCEKYYFPWGMKQIKNFPHTAGFFKNWLFPSIGNKKLSDVSSFDLEQIKTHILETRSPRTAQHVLALAKTAFNQARYWGFLNGNNPVVGVKMPKFDNRRVRFLTYEEAKLLIEECKRRTTPVNLIYPLVVTALTTGMRAGEIFNLRVQDLNFREGIIHIRDSKSGENGVAYMSEHLKEILKELVKGKKPYEHVFKKPNGKTFDAAPDVWKNIIRDLGFNKDITDPREKVVFHTLRHTFCSWLALAGVPLHIIKELARHKTIQMTERYSPSCQT